MFRSTAMVAVLAIGGAAGAQIVADGGFEAGPGGGFWTEFSTNFGSPICQAAVCGTGTGSGAHQGTFWAWFGGAPVFEQGFVSQEVVIPIQPEAALEFWLEIHVGSDPDDFLEVRLGGVLLGRWTADQSPQFQAYQPVTIDVSAFADGEPHELRFDSICHGDTISNFFVDAISLTASSCYADCEEDGDKDVFDFLCFQNRFALQDPYADCEHDGDWDVFDFLCFQGKFASCPL